MKKRIIALALCLAMCVSALAGCGSADPETNPATEPTPEVKDSTVAATEPVAEEVDYADTTFRIAWWGGDARNNQTIDIIENFEKEHKNLKVEVEYASNPDYWTKFKTQVSTGDVPDVFMMDYAFIGTYVEAGIMEPLDSYIDSGLIDFTNVEASTNAGAVLGGVTYGVVTGVNSPCIIYDPEILKEAGVTFSEEPTLSELGQVAKTVYEKTGKQVWCKAPMNLPWERYLISLGMQNFNKDVTDFAFTPEVLTEYLTFLYDGHEAGWLISDIEYSGDQGTNMREENPAWLEWSSNAMSNLIAGYNTGSGKNLAVLPHVKADKATANGNYLKPTMIWGIYSKSENKELACEFVNYFVNDTYVYDVCGIDRGMPISSETRNHIEPSFDEVGKQAKAYIDLLSKIGSPTPEATSLKSGDAYKLITEIYDMIRYDEIDRDEIADVVAERMEEGKKEIDKAVAER